MKSTRMDLRRVLEDTAQKCIGYKPRPPKVGGTHPAASQNKSAAVGWAGGFTFQMVEMSLSIAFYNEICLNKVRGMEVQKHLFYVSLCFRASGPRHFINRPSGTILSQ